MSDIGMQDGKSTESSVMARLMVMPRREFIGLGAAGLAAAATGSQAKAQETQEETRSLEELHQEALAEGGRLVIYAGGDTPQAEDWTKQAFLAAFPGMTLTTVVDYSKFHDVRLDNQFATNSLVPDVVQLQTLQNYPRWKREGRLLSYKPAGFSRVHDLFKDPDGAWTGIAVVGFSYMVGAGLAAGSFPASPEEFADPKWRGKLASTIPHDDDAALYIYKLYTETYGWEWVGRMVDQQIGFARGSHTPAIAVRSGEKPVGIAAVGSLVPNAQDSGRWVVADGHPFMAWGHPAAILKDARNIASAKLCLNWQLSVARQEKAFNAWSVRTDVSPAGGLPPIWEYQYSNVAGFQQFMKDREGVERWRQTFALYFGEVSGEPSPGRLGLHPGA